MNTYSKYNIDAKYSILIAGEKCDLTTIESFLKKGLKVFWFGTTKEKEVIEKKFVSFIECGFLNVFINNNQNRITIYDGKIDDIRLLQSLESGDENFNLKQYQIEHYDPNTNLIITAGAGTGKTHVMVNRIMFLMHYCKDFKFTDVAMITFTNKATDNMRKRLVSTLNSKYKLTGNINYLRRVEELSQITLSTIHSFFKKVLVTVSPMLGYGTNLELTSFIYEKQQILLDIINSRFNNSKKNVTKVLGLNVNSIKELAISYWTKIENCGITENELANMDWGKVSNETTINNENPFIDPVLIQNSLIEVFDQINKKYDELKFKRNSIDMSDIIHELSRVIQHKDIIDYLNKSYKYIFCDEFQDSDNIQIFTIVILAKLFTAKLFVVGDIKQSIYRFRGATDSAFEEIINSLRNNDLPIPQTIELEKNYRTSNSIMKTMAPKFFIWNSKKLLKDKGDLKAMKTFDGLFKIIYYKKMFAESVDNIYSDLQDKLISKINDIKREVEKQDIKPIPRTMVLTRTNKQLLTVKRWCEQHQIVCHIKERGTFFKSDAVKDFCAMIEALLYFNEPEYLYNYICSSYFNSDFDINDYYQTSFDKEELVKNFYNIIGEDKIKKYKNDLAKKPAISVINDIIEEAKPELRYYLMQVNKLCKKGFSEDLAKKQAEVNVASYTANLDKLLELLMEHFSGDFSSLYDICSFLRLKILTDKNEEEADITIPSNSFFIEGMTVHSSKGLEFDNVIIPFTDAMIVQDFRSEILISKENKTIGWKYVYNNNNEKFAICNNNYLNMQKDERNEVIQEETRLLYVAMTRAIKGLYCFCEKNTSSKKDDITCWGDLLKMGE